DRERGPPGQAIRRGVRGAAVAGVPAAGRRGLHQRAPPARGGRGGRRETGGGMTRDPRWLFPLLLPLLLAFDPLKSSNRDVEAGNAQMKAGKAEDALGSYDKAVAKLPGDPAVHFDRGTALYALSRFDEAGQEFLRATEAK